MEIALIADASIPALGSIGPVGWAILAVGAIAVLGYTAYEAGVFDWLGNKLDELGNIIQNEFDKVVEKAKSVWEEVDIPGKIEGIGEWLKDHILFAKGGKQKVKDSGLTGLSDQEIQDRYNNSSGKEKKRYEKELKGRKKKNVNKRKGMGHGK